MPIPKALQSVSVDPAHFGDGLVENLEAYAKLKWDVRG